MKTSKSRLSAFIITENHCLESLLQTECRIHNNDLSKSIHKQKLSSRIDVPFGSWNADTAMSFRKLLDALGVIQSFSKKGYPFDNACCESFFKYLKKDECNRRNYHTKKELERSVFQYIEGFYNSKRPHGSLGLMSPNEKEKKYWSK